MKTKTIIILFVIFTITILSCIIYKKNKVSISTIERSNSNLEKIVSIKNLNIDKIKQINIEVSGEEADTLNYDVNIEELKELNKKNNNILKIPIRYLIAGKISNILINIIKNDNKRIELRFKIKTDISKKIKNSFPYIKAIKYKEIKNRLYCFILWLALDQNKKPIMKTDFFPILVDSKANIRAFDKSFINKISFLKQIPKKVLNFKLDIERYPIYLKDKKHLIVFASDEKRKTITDFILEIDSNNNVIKEIDLTKVLDVYRQSQLDINNHHNKDGHDWLHPNSMVYDKKDDSIIVSARHQGVFKVDLNGKLKWLLSPHKGWKQEYKKYLLKAINSKNEILSNNIQDGIENYKDNNEEFEWCWGQHSVQLLNNNDILVFDNGFLRNFSNYDYYNHYSRVVIYRVDEKNMTVKQIWQYGKELGKSFSSPRGCTVYAYNETVFVNSSFIDKEKENANPCRIMGTVKEINIKTNDIQTDFYFDFRNYIEDKDHYWFDEIWDARIVNIDDIEK